MRPTLVMLFLLCMLLTSMTFAQTNVSVSRTGTGVWRVRVNGQAPVTDNSQAIQLAVAANTGINFLVTPSPRGASAELQLTLGTTSLADTKVANQLHYSIGSNLTIGSTALAGTNIRAIITFKPASGPAVDTTLTLSITKAAAVTANPAPAPPINVPANLQANPVAATASASFYLPGNLYYDAQALIDPKTSQEEWANILRYYNMANTTDLYRTIVGDIPNWTNPFLKTVFSDASHLPAQPISQQNRNPAAAAQGATTAIQSAATAVSKSGVDLTSEVITALTDFIVKRAKQELTISFFEKLQKLLAKPEFADLRSVFPNTYQTFNNIGDQIYNYTAYLNGLQASFQKDLNALLTNLPTVIPHHPNFFKDHPELAAILKSACYIGNGLLNKDNPGNLIEKFPDTYLVGLDASVIGSVQTVKLLSFGLKDSSSSTDAPYWISDKQMTALLRNSVLLNTWVGLIYQKAKKYNKNGDIVFAGNVTLTSKLDLVGNDLTSLSNFISGLTDKINKLNTAIQQLKNSSKDSLALLQYTNFFTSCIGVIQQCTQINTIEHFDDIISQDALDKINKLCNVANTAADLALSIGQKNYSSAILDATIIYKDLNTAPPIEHPTSPADQASDNLKTTVFQLASFLASVAQAKGSSDMENAIEAFALPIGSSRIKRESLFNVSINSYLGLYYGHESVSGITDHLAFNAYGVTAPVGFAISRGHSFLFLGTGEKGWKSGKYGWSTSLFISLIDLGAVAAYRVNNDSVASVPSIQLKDIFSPGAFISLGIPKTPVSIGLGAQFGPNLRNVTSTQNNYEGKTYVRYSMSLLVDIPLLNLYTKTR